MKPRIALSARVTGEAGKEHAGMHVDYLSSVVTAGGVPIMLSSLLGASLAAAALDGCHGLVLTGGEDLAPEHYGEARSPTVKKVDQVRDAFELALFAEARKRKLPVLAICRGFQLANVALGGSLWQDLAEHCVTDHDHDEGETWRTRNHLVHLEADSKVAAATGELTIHANSFHHQAVRELAQGLQTVARAPDGIVEAAEYPGDDWWFLGVQWHPENFWEEDGPDLGLFRALVTAAARAPATRA